MLEPKFRITFLHEEDKKYIGSRNLTLDEAMTNTYIETNMLEDIQEDLGNSYEYIEYVTRKDMFSGLKDLGGIDIYEKDIVYLAGVGNCIMEFPFQDLYDAMAEKDIGKIVGNVHRNGLYEK